MANGEERRIRERKAVDIPAELQISLPDESYSSPHAVRIVDISTLGAGVELNATEMEQVLSRLDQSRMGRLKVKSQPRKFHLYCKVVWIDEENGHLGLWFTDENQDLEDDPDFRTVIQEFAS